MKQKLNREWNNILMLEKSSPYIFRTRLERVLNHTIKFAKSEKDKQLLEECMMIIHKLKYISDQSNQTVDGCLNSFIILKQDMANIKDKFKEQYA